MPIQESTPPRRRGRPRKVPPSLSQELFPADLDHNPWGDKPGQGKVTDDPMPDQGKSGGYSPTPVQTLQARGDNSLPRFILSIVSDRVHLDLTDRRGIFVEPEPLKFSGLARQAMNEYSIHVQRSKGIFHWGVGAEELPVHWSVSAYESGQEAVPGTGTGDGQDRIQGVVPPTGAGAFPGKENGSGSVQGAGSGIDNPEARLLTLAASAMLLHDKTGERISLAPTSARLVLAVSGEEKAGFSFAPALLGSEDETNGTPEGELTVSGMNVIPVCSSLVLCDNVLTPVPDLGPRWRELSRLPGQADRDHMEIILASSLSRLDGLGIYWPGWTIGESEPREARPGIVFDAVDREGYLHLHAGYALPGYPPGFLETQGITRAVTLDQERKAVSIFEVVYGENPSTRLQALINGTTAGSRAEVVARNGYFVLPKDSAERFLASNMSALLAGFILFQTRKLASYRIRPARPRLRLALKTGIQYLEGEAEVEIEGEVFPYSRFMAEYRNKSFIELSDGSKGCPEPGEVARFSRILSLVRGEDTSVRLSRFDLPLLSPGEREGISGGENADPEAFYRGLSSLEAEASRDIEGTEILDPYAIEGARLRGYQRYGTRWLDYLRQHGMGGCLADEMGLGKTVQTIALLRSVYRAGERIPTLVVLPRSLLSTWADELGRFAPDIRVTEYYGSDRDPVDIAGSMVILTTYSVLRRDLPYFELYEYCYLVLDESQTIKNQETLTSRAVNRLQARHRLALSGTPVENGLSELYALFDFLNPGMFGSKQEFQERYLGPVQERGEEDALRDLRLRIYPFILRRMKKDVLPELPDKTEQVCMIDLDPAHLAFYQRRRAELKLLVEGKIRGEGLSSSRFIVLQAFSELRRLASLTKMELAGKGVAEDWATGVATTGGLKEAGIEETGWLDSGIAGDAAGAGTGQEAVTVAVGETGRRGGKLAAGGTGIPGGIRGTGGAGAGVGISAKREFLRERLAQVAESGHKALVFTNYLATVDLVTRDLHEAGIGAISMTGASQDRQALVTRFQSDPDLKTFVMTLRTGGLGLTLTAADYVFIVDPWWNRSAESQAVDRTHRIGQKNPVFCYRLIARGTIEEKMLVLQERKASLVASLVASDAEAFKVLDEADIAFLLG